MNGSLRDENSPLPSVAFISFTEEEEKVIYLQLYAFIGVIVTCVVITIVFEQTEDFEKSLGSGFIRGIVWPLFLLTVVGMWLYQNWER